jgi:large subunit ribosomal protein L15
MDLSNLKPAAGSVKKAKRIGRGQGSGKGGTSTRGHKGAGSRSGTSRKAGFEGGQMPIQRRIPKYGFKNPHRVEYAPVNLSDLQRVSDTYGITTFEAETYSQYGFSSRSEKIKVLGNGELNAAVTVRAHAFSKSAKDAIEKAGGTAETI